MAGDFLSAVMAPAVLVSLRIGPVLAFAPPFTLVRVPALVRLLTGLGLSGALVAGHVVEAGGVDLTAGPLLVAVARELLLGTLFLLSFQIAFGALYIAGRALDIQAGFGLATLIDPTSRAPLPLVGTVFVYAAGLIFFAAGGQFQLVQILAASLDAVPIGGGKLPGIGAVTSLASASMSIAVGAAGATILALFLADLCIALLARTAPQLNALVLGVQVKTILLLVTLMLSFGLISALLGRLMSAMLAALPHLI